MTLLLDTHVLLWWLAGSRRLGRRATSLIQNPSSTVLVSAATTWEIAIKVSLGRLDLGAPPEIVIPRELERNGFLQLPVTVAHSLAISDLARHHSDPFDRLLIAQARVEGLTLVTADERIARYGAPIIDASR